MTFYCKSHTFSTRALRHRSGAQRSRLYFVLPTRRRNKWRK